MELIKNSCEYNYNDINNTIEILSPDQTGGRKRLRENQWVKLELLLLQLEFKRLKQNTDIISVN